MQKENTIKLDPAFINQKEFFDKTTFDNIEIEKFGAIMGRKGILCFNYKITSQMDMSKEFLRYYIDKNEVKHSSNTCKLEDFLEYQKLINQALNYIASYTKTIENN